MHLDALRVMSMPIHAEVARIGGLYFQKENGLKKVSFQMLKARKIVYRS